MAKDTKIKIPESEWEVLRVLWQRGPCSVSQIQTTLAVSGNPCTLGAIRSFLKRLAAKNIVRELDDEPILRFEALYDEETLLCEERNSFLERYFDGTVSALLAHYFRNEKVPKAEIQRLKQLLEEYKSDKPQGKKGA